MKVDVEELEPCKRRLVVEAPEAEVTAAWEAACGRVQREARLPGFRPGKVPRSLVRVHFAHEVRRAVVERLVPEVYRRALDETRLDPVEEPEVGDLQLEEGRPLRFTAVVEVKPAITPADYRGVPVTHTPLAVTDADVEEALRTIARRQATLSVITRPARTGDHVIVDYTVTPDGLEPRIEQGHAFQVGQGRVLPEMEEAVLGLAAGDERQVTVRFPADHRREELRGRSGSLRLRVIEVKEEEVPDLDDELAQAVSSQATLGALREQIRIDLALQRERHNRHLLEERTVDALLARHDFAVPESLILREIAHRIERAQGEMRRAGVNPDQVPWDYAKLSAELRPSATRVVRRALLLDAIARTEEIAVDEGEIEAEIERLAREAGRAPAAMRRLLERGGDLEGLRHVLRESRILALLVEHAVVRPES